MANYPVKLLKDKDGTAFVPVVNSDSIITPEGDTLNDLLEEKQDLLTSGTNIKTINNESLLGSGNISIQGGGDATDVQVNGVSITQNNVANIATQTAYNSLTNKIATKNDIPTQTSQLTNNSGYITSSVDNLTNYTKTNDLSEVATSGSYEDLSNKPTIPSKMSDLTNDNNFVSDASYVHTDNNYTSTEKNKLSGIASGAEVNVQSNWTETNTSSDAYIKNKPTIPTVNNGKLTIQKNGTDVQTFTANQSSNVTANITVPTQVSELTNDSGYTTNTGTITKVQANGTDVASSGTANIPAATTSKYGVTELSSATNSTSEALAATPKAVKAAYDLAASKGTGTITGVSVNGTSVATSGVANITSVPASVLSGAIPSAVTATTQTSSDNSTKIATTAFVKTAIDNLPEPMVFKGSLGMGGTITSLPTNGTATVGDTYKVITDGIYASKAAKVGDTFICLTKTSSANTWELIPSGDDTGGTVTSVKINATSPIVIDNSTAITTSGERTISHAASGVTAGTYKSVTVDSKGHVTEGTNPTTLSGYGITDAGISNGTITLGSNTITPSTVQNIKDGSATGSLRSSDSSTEDANYIIGGYAFAEGYKTKASGSCSHAEGNWTTASGSQSHAEGDNTIASGNRSHAEGDNTIASAYYSHAEGCYTQASGRAAHAEGYYTTASGSYGAHAEGSSTRAIGNSSHAEGSGAVASNSYSHAEGRDTIASGKYSHAEGGRNDSYLFIGTVVSLNAENQTYEVSGVPKEAIGDNLFYSGAFYSENNSTDSDQRIVSATRSSSTNNVTFTVSTFDSSIAVGDNFRVFAGSKASGDYSHAEGYRAYAIGNYSHAEGYETIATGMTSHAEGYNTIASGSQSHAGGYYTKANKDYQTAIGKYNKNVDKALLEIGNGTADDARSNAFVVYSDGKAELGADPTSSMHVATKQYVDNKTSSVALSNIKDGSTAGSVRTSYSSSEDSSYTIGDYSFTEGFRTKASGNRSHAEGSFTTASGEYSHAEGNDTTASGDNSHAEGYCTTASEGYSHAEGYYTKAKGASSHAEGCNTTTSGSDSHAEGFLTTASGNYSHAEGGFNSSSSCINNFKGTVVSLNSTDKTYEVSGLTKYLYYTYYGTNYVGFIYNKTESGRSDYRIISETYDETTHNFTFTVSNFDSSIVVGDDFYLIASSNAIGQYSHSEGANNVAAGSYSHAEGVSNKVLGESSHVEGSNNIVSTFNGHAEGEYTTVKTGGAHAEGFDTFAAGYGAHAEGFESRAIGDHSHAENCGGIYSLIKGTIVSLDETNKTYEINGLTRYVTSNNNYINCVFTNSSGSHMGNKQKIVSETYDSTTGNFTFTVSVFNTDFNVGDNFYIAMGCTAWGEGSHVNGLATIAKKNFQTAVGKFNDNKNDTLFEVGNGTSTTRSNAFEVYSDGKAIVGADPTTAMGVATKQYVDNAISATDTGWVDLTPSTGTWSYLKCRRIGNIVYVRGYATSFSYSGTATVITTLPTQFRPADIIYVYGFLAGRRMSRWYITDAGNLGIDWAANISDGSVYTNNATWHEFNTTYMVD